LISKLPTEVRDLPDVLAAWLIHWYESGLPQAWMRILETRIDAVNQAMRDAGTSRRESIQVRPEVAERGIKEEVRPRAVQVRQDKSMDLMEFLLQFEKRMRLAEVAMDRWMSELESSLNDECRKRFWLSWQEGISYKEQVKRMLEHDGRYSEVKLRQAISAMRQARGESAAELLVRLREAYTKLEWITNKTVAADDKQATFLSKLWRAEEVELMAGPKASIDDLVRVAGILQGRQQGGQGASERQERRAGPPPPRRREIGPSAPPRPDVKAAPRGTCFKCGKTGHFRRNCPEKEGSIKAQSLDPRVEWRSGKMGGKPAAILLDSCAAVSVVSGPPAGAEQLEGGKIAFHWGRELVESRDKYAVDVRIGSREARCEVWQVSPEFLAGADVLLSREDCRKLGFRMVQEADGDEKNPEAESRILSQVDAGLEEDDWPELNEEFIKFGPVKVDASAPEEVRKAVSKIPVAENLMDLREPAKLGPVEFHWKQGMPESIVCARRSLSVEQEDYLRGRLAELKAAGIYKTTDSPYASPWVVVRKPKGGWRDTIDLRKVNDWMRYPDTPCGRFKRC
jgi:hypothetical protein